MENKATCVLPKPSRSPEIRYEGKEPEIWLGEIDHGMKVWLEAFLQKHIPIVQGN